MIIVIVVIPRVLEVVVELEAKLNIVVLVVVVPSSNSNSSSRSIIGLILILGRICVRWLCVTHHDYMFYIIFRRYIRVLFLIPEVHLDLFFDSHCVGLRQQNRKGFNIVNGQLLLTEQHKATKRAKQMHYNEAFCTISVPNFPK